MAYDKLQLIVGLLITSSQIIAHNLDDFVAPANAAVLQGNRSELRCRPNSSSDIYSWAFTPVGTTEEVIIYSSVVGTNNKTSFNALKLSDGSVDLSTNSTQLNDAGLYTCMIRVNVSEEGATYIAMIKQTAELIVLEIEPTCKTTPVENERTEMQCTVIYRGNWVPVMKGRENDEPIIRDDVENVTVSNVTVTSTLRLLVRNDVNNYTCMVYFSENITSDQDTTQATFYACTWTSESHKSSITTTTAQTLFNNAHALIAVAIFAAAFSAVAVFVLLKAKVYRKDKNSVQSDEPLNENDYFQDLCQYEEIADCGEVIDTVKSSQSLQIDQDIGKTHDLKDERSFAATTNLTRVQMNGKTRFVGEDGTEYLDLNGLKEQRQSKACALYSSTIYEEVDHNINVSALQL